MKSVYYKSREVKKSHTLQRGLALPYRNVITLAILSDKVRRTLLYSSIHPSIVSRQLWSIAMRFAPGDILVHCSCDVPHSVVL